MSWIILFLSLVSPWEVQAASKIESPPPALRECFEAGKREKLGGLCILPQQMELAPELAYHPLLCAGGYHEVTRWRVFCSRRHGIPPANPLGYFRFGDGFCFSGADRIESYASAGKIEGKEVQVLLGKYFIFAHVMGTSLIKQVPRKGGDSPENFDSSTIPTDLNDFQSSPAFAPACDQHPKDQSCVVYGDGYRTLVRETGTGALSTRTVDGKIVIQRVRACHFDYFHILNTDLVRSVPRALPSSAPMTEISEKNRPGK